MYITYNSKSVCIINGTVVVLQQETHIGKTVNALKKRKGVIGSSALNLINSWKQLVNSTTTKPKPIVVVQRCDSPTEEDDDDDDDDDTERISHSRLVGENLLSEEITTKQK